MFLRTSSQLLPLSLMVVLVGLTSSITHAQEVDSVESTESASTEQGEIEETSSGTLDSDSTTDSSESNVSSDNVAEDSETESEEETPKDFETLMQRTGLTGQGATSVVETATVQDIAAFKQSYKRYRDRLDEFSAETIEMVEIRHAEGRNNIVDKYDEPLSKLEADLAIQKETMVSRFERFLQKYPNKVEGAEIRFQLGDIYFQEAVVAFQQAEADYEAAWEENPDLENTNKLDLMKAFTMYQEIADKFPDAKILDAALYMMGVCQMDQRADVYQPNEAIASFKKIVELFPDSEWSAQANYLIGKHYFDDQDNETALTYFKRAEELTRPKPGEYDSLYENASYLLAWTHYNLNQYQEALTLFKQGQDYSERKEREVGEPSLTLEESLEYTALSFYGQYFDNGMGSSALDVAKTYYEQNGENQYTPEMYVALADFHKTQSEILEAVDVYRFLQEHWPNAPENPTHQKILAELLLAGGEIDAYFEEMALLSDRYAENGSWWIANDKNPGAQDVARSYIEGVILELAYNQYNKAIESELEEDYLFAVDSFERFLTKFPLADEFYEALWYKADAMQAGGDMDGAQGEYQELVKTSIDHHRGELAQIRLTNLTNIKAQNALAGDFAALPEGAAVKEDRTLPDGSSFTVYELPTAAVEFIQDFTASVELDFDGRMDSLRKDLARTQEDLTLASSEGEIKKLTTEVALLEQIQGEVEGAETFFVEAVTSYKYNIGQIYMGHNQYDLAREYFNELIAEYPTSLEASFSAQNIITTYQKELNWDMVQSEAGRFIELALGPDGTVPEDFAVYQQNAILQILVRQTEDAQKMMSRGEVDEAARQFNMAADGFLEYLERYDSIDEDEYANLLLSAGNFYTDGGNLERANEVYKQYVDRFPDKKASRALLFDIATNYQNALELEEAIQYFDILYKQTAGKGIEYAGAANALYNSALLKVGLGQYQEAAEGLEFFAKKFSDDPNAEATFFMAGQYWEKVANWRGLEFYTRYLKQYKGLNPDNTMAAHYRRIEMYRERGKAKERDIEREWKELMKSYEAMVAEGKDSPLMKKYAAEYYTREIPTRLQEFRKVKYGRNGEENQKTLIAQRDALVEIQTWCADLPKRFSDFEALVAARYCAGAAEMHYSIFVLNFPEDTFRPAGLSGDALFDAQIVFKDQINEAFKPEVLKDNAITTLEQAITLSEKQGRWVSWTQLALNELSAIDPKSYPPQKTELYYSVQSVYVSPSGPVSVDVPGAKIESSSPEEASLNEVSPTENDTVEVGTESENGQESPPVQDTDTEIGWGEETPEEASSESSEPSEDGSNDDDNTEDQEQP